MMLRVTIFIIFSCSLVFGNAVQNAIPVSLKEGTNFAVDVSPSDGSFILDIQGTLWRLSPQGGQAIALTDGLGDDRSPDYSDDGTSVTFQSFRNGTWDIWLMRADGNEKVAVTESRFDDREPVFSPDGTRIAFSSDRKGNYDIWILEIKTGELSQLTHHKANDYMPFWLPNGEGVVFVSERYPTGTALYEVESSFDNKMLQTTEPREIVGFDTLIAAPSVSPDGRDIALRVLDIGTTSADAMGTASVASRLVIVSRENGKSVNIDSPPDVFPFRPVWISEAELVYTADGRLWRHQLFKDAGLSNIPFEANVTLDRSTYQRRKVVFPSKKERLSVRGLVRPVVSPDGSQIAFSALGDIWRVGATGGTPVAVTRDEYLDTDPHWSPDSRSIVYSSDRGGTMDLWVKDTESKPTALGRRLTFSIGAEFAPSWSPDGTEIAYVDHSSQLHVISVANNDDRILTNPQRGISQPSWSPDNVHVVFSVHQPLSTRFREGYNRIVVVDTQNGDSSIIEQPELSISGRDGEGPVWGPNESGIAFFMDGGLWVLPVAEDGTLLGKAKKLLGETGDFPSWLPDGQGIIFVTPRGIKHFELESLESHYIPINLDYEIFPTAGKLLIRNVNVLDGTGAPARSEQDVILEGSRILSISPTTELNLFPEIRTIDGRGRTLIPGLIEMHTHLSLPAFGSRHGKIWLAYGVTAIRTPADTPYRVLEERESVRSGKRIGPRIFFTGGTLDGDRVYYSGGLAISDEEELEQEMQRAFDLEYDIIKTYVRLPDAFQKVVVDEAHSKGVFVTSHEIYPAVSYGVDGVEHIAGTSRRGFSPKFSDLRRTYGDVIELISQSGVFFTPTILIYGGWSLALAREPDLLEENRFQMLYPSWSKERLLVSQVPMNETGSRKVMEPIFETIAELRNRGSRIIAGTDSPIVPYGFGLILEIEQLSEAGLGPSLAIRSATQLAAEALGAGDDLGTVEAGKIADLVLVKGDPTQNIKDLRRTEVVIVDGRVVTIPRLLNQP